MPRVQIPINDIVRAGLAQPAQVTADATNNHYLDSNSGNVFIEVISSDAGSQTVTVKAGDAITTDGLTLSDLTLTVAAGATKYFGPFRPRTFKQSADSNRIYLNPSVSTTLKFRAYSLTAAT